MSTPRSIHSSDSFYAKWKDDLMHRALAGNLPVSPRYGISVIRTSCPVPQRPAARRNSTTQRIARPHSAKVEPNAASTPNSNREQLPTKPYQALRPSSARLPLGKHVSTTSWGAALRDRYVPAAPAQLESSHQKRFVRNEKGRGRCDLLVEVERIAASGMIGACYDHLQSLADCDGGTLPTCCVNHALLVARVTLVAKGPLEALCLYQRISPGCIPPGELNAAQTVQRMTTSGGLQWFAHVDAVIDALQHPAPPIAAAYLLMKATRLVTLDRLDEGLIAASLAARLCPASCDAATLCSVLRYALDERSVWWVMEAPTDPVASKGVGAVPSKTHCHDRLHHCCNELGTLLTILQRATTEAKEMPCDMRRHAIERTSAAVDQERIPITVARRLQSKLDHARVEALLEAGDGARALELVATFYDASCCVQAERWCWLMLRCLESDGRLGDAFEHCCHCCECGAIGDAMATRWKQYIASAFVKRAAPAEYRVASRGVTSCHVDIAPYEALGFASWESVHVLPRGELQKRYRKMCLVLHPDKWMGQGQMRNLARYCFQWMTNAYQALLLEL